MDTPQFIKKQNPVIRYFKNSYDEVRKVTWPTKAQATNMVVIVVVISLITGGFIAAFDYLFTQGYEKLLEYRGPGISAPFVDTTETPVSNIPITLPTTVPETPTTE